VGRLISVREIGYGVLWFDECELIWLNVLWTFVFGSKKVFYVVVWISQKAYGVRIELTCVFD
jgi:hypothetical protein